MMTKVILAIGQAFPAFKKADAGCACEPHGNSLAGVGSRKERILDAVRLAAVTSLSGIV